MICLRPRAGGREQTLCSPSCAPSPRCHLPCRTSSACKLCLPPPSSGFSVLPSSAEVHLVSSEAIWFLLKPAVSTSCSKCTLLTGRSTPKTQVLPCLHLLVRYPLLRRCLCHNQTGTVPWSCLGPIPDSCVDREVFWKKIICQPKCNLLA